MTEPDVAAQEMALSGETIVLADRVVSGGFFVTRSDALVRTPFVVSGDDHTAPYRHCCTYAGGGSSILPALIELLDEAKEKVFVGTLFLGDGQVREALVRAANRLGGGVYVISALDDKGLDTAINKVDDATPIDKQTEYRNFRELTRRGIYVRGYPGVHAKFVVVDDRAALVSSANLVTRSFDEVGENGVVVTGSIDVDRLARLFARLWHESVWDMPPDPDHHTVRKLGRNQAVTAAVKVPGSKGNGPVWTCEALGHYDIAGALHEIVESAEADLILATYSIANMAYGLPGMVAHPELLFDPVCRAVERGVRARMLLRGRNQVRASRAEATEFAKAGVEIYADRLTHAKGVIADGRFGALFSANFLTDQGLTGGVEVGMRLDDTSALTEAQRYFEHVMTEASMGFVLDPRLGQLADTLYAEALSRWPLSPTVEVMANDAAWERLARQQGVVLYERSGAGPITLYCGRDRWKLEGVEGWWWLAHEARVGKGQRAADVFETWLTTRDKVPEGVQRGLCPATLVRTDHH